MGGLVAWRRHGHILEGARGQEGIWLSSAISSPDLTKRPVLLGYQGRRLREMDGPPHGHTGSWEAMVPGPFLPPQLRPAPQGKHSAGCGGGRRGWISGTWKR